MRDLKKSIAEGKKIIDKHPALDMTISELRTLTDPVIMGTTPDAIFDLVSNVFLLGVYAGSRADK